MLSSADLHVFAKFKNFIIDTRTDLPHLPMTLIISNKVAVLQENDKAINNTVMFSRNPDDIDRFVKSLSELNHTSFFHDLLLKISDSVICIGDMISELVIAMQDAAVKRKPKTKCNNNRPLCFDKDYSTAKKTNYQALRRFRNSNTDTDLSEYLAKCNDFKNLIRTKKQDFNENQIDYLDSKTFWGKIKSMSGKNTRKSLGKISKEDWYKHFQNLFKTTENINVPVELEIDAPDDEIEFLIFSSEITDDEILAAIKHLKVGKSAGPDNLIREFFKKSIHIILPVLNKLFNRLFLNGYFPPCWSKSILVPLHKKGDINNTENYRGICLLDVLGKIFTSIINRRVTFYVNLYSKISEAQFGFREGYSTVDNAFILNSIIERYLAKKKGKIYVCFVDFKRAFDSVNREKLWAVLKTNGLKGNLMKVIKSMYKGVKTCVRVDGDYTDYFNCDEGLKQGYLFSQILFSMFVNEFTKIIETSGLRGIQ